MGFPVSGLAASAALYHLLEDNVLVLTFLPAAPVIFKGLKDYFHRL